ncbi:hypothetical protein [Dysgonomonas sp. 520]|nr:hypothetical protein [Dysgonomonas sp. 520]
MRKVLFTLAFVFAALSLSAQPPQGGMGGKRALGGGGHFPLWIRMI